MGLSSDYIPRLQINSHGVIHLDTSQTTKTWSLEPANVVLSLEKVCQAVLVSNEQPDLQPTFNKWVVGATDCSFFGNNWLGLATSTSYGETVF